MKQKDQIQKTREGWIRTYEQLGSISKAARRCGIARSTLQRWLRRLPVEGLADRSKRPHRLARPRLDDETENLILEIRDTYRLGKIRICSHLLQHYQLRLSPSTVARVLKRHGKRRLKRYRKFLPPKRYSKDIPGERVQMDVCKIATGIYQYTAIDDCTRFRVLHIYSRRTAKNSIDFLERVVEQMPFPIQRIQTDRGTEFLAISFQQEMQRYCIAAANRQIQAHKTLLTSFKRKSRKKPFYRPPGVLHYCKSKGSCFKRQAGGMAVSLQLVPSSQFSWW